MGTMKHTIFSSFQKRVSFSFVLLCALFVLLTTLLAGATLYRVYQDQTGERLAFEQAQLKASLDKMAVSMNDFTNSLIIQLNNNAGVSLSAIAASSEPELRDMEYLARVTSSNLTLFSDVSSINILLNNGALYTAAENELITFRQTDEAFLTAMQALDISTKGTFLDLSALGYPATTRFFCKELRDITTNETVGLVFLEVRARSLQEYCISENSSAVIISDQDGSVIAHSGSFVLPEEGFSPSAAQGQLQDAEGSTWLYRSGVVSLAGWHVTCLLNTRQALLPIYDMLTLLTAAALLVLLVMSGVAMLIARRLARPIEHLSRHMSNCTGAMPLPVEPRTDGDEIAVLYSSFNSMLLQNARLFEDYKREQKRKQTIELQLIQSQIKPHFLYNTLDTIYCLAGMGRTDEASRVTKALADYYRLVLNSGQEWISVRQEMTALNRYLTIMKVRWPELEYSLECDPALEEVTIPKLLLQPLVENSIQHGIRPLHRGGTVRVVARTAPEGVVELCVMDNGCGMTEEQFAQALRGKRSGRTDEASFGLHSVERRLALFYGTHSQLVLDRQDGWTVVKLRIEPGEARDV